MNLVVLLVTPALVGIALGLATGGSWRRLLDARFHGLALLWAAAAVQAVQWVVGGGLLLVAVYLLVVAWIGANIGRTARPGQAGLGLVLAGLLLNALPIALNGRMPFSPEAAVAAGFRSTGETAENVPADASTRLAWLGDTLPVAGLNAVISVGDIAIACGIVVIACAMTHLRTREEVNDEERAA